MHETLPSALGQLGQRDQSAFSAFQPPEGAPNAHDSPVLHIPETCFYKRSTPFVEFAKLLHNPEFWTFTTLWP